MIERSFPKIIYDFCKALSNRRHRRISEVDNSLRRLGGVVVRVAEIANAHAIPRAQVALAWLLAKAGHLTHRSSAPPSHHLDDALALVAVKLTEEIAAFEEHYVPHTTVGFV